MPPSTSDAAPRGAPVHAAGCVLWRAERGDPAVAGGVAVEVALVHRPKYDDWSHPKGKLHPGESAEAAAVREVREETGARCVLGARLTTVRYAVEGRPKTVDYWVAEAVSGTFVPSREIDRVAWLPPRRARLLLTHPRDRALLDAALTSLTR
ncbi:NUDIX hydrolase [Streptomyces chumphonensis]|uniref:NUDIX hydrolase n=1 Tax=Streptomyces chumphonensis TaxID=1214925 RepID=UPI003D74ED2D